MKGWTTFIGVGLKLSVPQGDSTVAEISLPVFAKFVLPMAS